MCQKNSSWLKLLQLGLFNATSRKYACQRICRGSRATLFNRHSDALSKQKKRSDAPRFCCRKMHSTERRRFAVVQRFRCVEHLSSPTADSAFVPNCLRFVATRRPANRIQWARPARAISNAKSRRNASAVKPVSRVKSSTPGNCCAMATGGAIRCRVAGSRPADVAGRCRRFFVPPPTHRAGRRVRNTGMSHPWL